MSQPPLNYQTPQPPQRPSEDSEISGIEWVVIVLCSGIGCILGIIYMIQGKPKGAKVLGYSVLVMVVVTAIRFVAAMAMQHR